MYLKSIEVQGFKSFANKILFEFHNGITGIVGPNGSGKSNVADAVRWVLGEQRAKQLRGANMQDVIFSGTETRKPLSYAYVAITLDNSDHQLTIDYEEVTVARRVYRSGESEYLINGASCRLKDVNELFYDTGIGKEGYSIIGQGQIDKILSGKPEERRELFDEAAGIVKFKRRKAAAQKKLEDERQNLLRINDILSELEKQLPPLEKQSETAKIYLKKKEELKIYDVNMFLREMERMKEQLSIVEEKSVITEKELSLAKEGYDSIRSEYERLEADLEKLSEDTEKYREKSNHTKIGIGQLEGQINVLKEQINTVLLEDKHLRSREEVIEQELSERNKELERLWQEKNSLDLVLEEIDSKQMISSAQLQKLRDGINQINGIIEYNKSEILEILNVRSSTKAKLQRYETMLEQVQIRKAELSQKLLRIKSEESEQEEYEKLWQKDEKEIENNILKSQKSKEEMEKSISDIQELLTRKKEESNSIQGLYHREKSRLDSLRNLTERYDGYGNSIKRVMECRDREPGIIGVVSDIIQVEKKYEVAIETALGGSIQNLVTDNETTAKRMIEYLKKNHYGRATFLPLTNMRNNTYSVNEALLSETGVLGIGSQLVKTEKEYAGLCRYLLGRTIVVDHIDHAIALGKKYNHSLRIVTLEGESLSPGGSMTGGAFKNTSNLLGRRREIEELEVKVQSIRHQLETLYGEIELHKDKRTELREKTEGVKKELQEFFLLQNTNKIRLSGLADKKLQIENNLKEALAEIQEIEKQILYIKEEKERIETEFSESETKEKDAGKEITTYELQLEEENKKLLEAGKENSKIEVDAATIKQKNQSVQENIRRIETENQKLKEEKESLAENIENASRDMAEKQEEIKTLQKEIDSQKELDEKYRKEIEILVKKKEELSSSHKKFFIKREELSEKVSNLDKECFRLNSQKEKLEEQSEAQIGYMWDEYEITYGLALSMKKEDLEAAPLLKKHIQELKEEIKKLGDVNVNSIEDYKNVKERFEFLNGQKEDLVTAEENLLKIIKELDTGMRNQFKERFSLIQKEFDKAFKELFGGGKGTLELIDEEDILECGVNIISQPPGKKLQNMMQLSGGEKALTAIALLFAIQNLKPSPFCLLDEIEAALDDSNVVRFARYLHKLTKNTQFIIITHRRGTMAAADRLYGVTMQEKGVSTLVSVSLIEEDLDK